MVILLFAPKLMLRLIRLTGREGGYPFRERHETCHVQLSMKSISWSRRLAHTASNWKKKLMLFIPIVPSYIVHYYGGKFCFDSGSPVASYSPGLEL